ncbi:hypothetical protein [Halalkalibacter hemicellulosilyticus]|uniref:Uncharacterized protein n=1 Tax=Halalkalibacter hemicellulosilyticusJCM 9152 TaxID=1236971 RepID=W4QKN9_9BACI|nr:hypothetical protein [Halalkalibacter hemicellulosilyticus]GAE32452.1 hypothetical protein JCM9152_3987 [Halalkalibacter hemicellulosilyticusJCM 9152]
MEERVKKLEMEIDVLKGELSSIQIQLHQLSSDVDQKNLELESRLTMIIGGLKM